MKNTHTHLHTFQLTDLVFALETTINLIWYGKPIEAHVRSRYPDSHTALAITPLRLIPPTREWSCCLSRNETGPGCQDSI